MKKTNLKIFIGVFVCMIFVLVFWVYFLKINFRTIDNRASVEGDNFWQDFFNFDLKIEQDEEIKESFQMLNEMMNATSTTSTIDVIYENETQEQMIEDENDNDSTGEVLGAKTNFEEELKIRLAEKIKEKLEN